MKSKLYDMYEQIVFLDTETTGFDPVKNQIIEYAALKVSKDGSERPVDTYVQLETEQGIPERITALTGITELDLVKGVSELELLGIMTTMFTPDKDGKILLVAHNAQFDLNFIGNAYLRHLKQTGYGLIGFFSRCDYLDTLTVYKDRAGFPHKLQSAIDHYGLSDKVQNTHRAIDDARALEAVFDAMSEERDDLDQYVNVFGFNKKYGIDGARLKKVTYGAQEIRFGMSAPDDIFPIWIGTMKKMEGMKK